MCGHIIGKLISISTTIYYLQVSPCCFPNEHAYRILHAYYYHTSLEYPVPHIIPRLESIRIFLAFSSLVHLTISLQ